MTFEAVQVLSSTTWEIGKVAEISRDLAADPNPSDPRAPAAAEQMVEALEEMSLVFNAIESEFSRYFALNLRALSTKERLYLDGLSVGKGKDRLAELRGHCDRIYNTYKAYVAPWVNRVIDTAAQQVYERSPPAVVERDELYEKSNAIHALFESFGHQYDVMMMDAVTELGAWFQRKAGETVDFLDNEQYDEAFRHRVEARAEVKAAREAVIDAFTKIATVRAKFDSIVPQPPPAAAGA